MQQASVSVRLHHRVRRLVFVVATLITSAFAALELATLLYELPRDARSANATVAKILGSYLTVSINDRINDLVRLSDSTLVWNALSDSRGRDAYLKPFFDEQNAAFRNYQLSLLDYRGRYVAGADLSKLNDSEIAHSLATETLESGCPSAQMLPAPNQRLFVTMPVFFRYTEEPVGVMLGKVDIAGLLDAQQVGDLEGLNVRVFAAPGSDAVPGGERTRAFGHAPERFEMRNPEMPHLYQLTLEISSSSNPWLEPLLMRLLAWIPVLLFFVLLSWWLAGLLARRCSRRIEALAAILSKESHTIASEIPDDDTGDEIALLSLQLRNALKGREEANAELERLAHYDALTSLINRVAFERNLSSALERAIRQGYKLGLLFIDLDHFKAVNDQAGRAAGDEVLEMVSARLTRRVRASDLVSRRGGDEFTVMLEPCDSPLTAEWLAWELVEAIKEPYALSDGRSVCIGASIGIALYPRDGESAQALLAGADQAMYRVKDGGRGAVIHCH